jgi:hypothetical protein
LCELKEVISLDSRRVALTFEAPQVAALTTFRVSLSVSYDYNGTRQALIPIIDGTSLRRPLNQFTDGQPSFGPVKIEYQPPIGATSRQGDRVVNEYWAVSRIPATVKLVLSHIGTVPNVQTIQFTNIEIKSSLPQVSGEMAKDSSCPTSGKFGKIPFDNVQLRTGRTLTYSCQFVYDLVDRASANIDLTTAFSYLYTFTRTETFSVIPNPFLTTTTTPRPATTTTPTTPTITTPLTK